jgi:DNA mismatch endonuclease, patch repair protein
MTRYVPRPRAHRGDIMPAETRSRVMSHIRGKDTGPERLVAEALADRGLQWERHSPDLPGRPDLVFRKLKVAVFIDGDFWHGWKFNDWRHKLSEKWEAKIGATRRRDRVNHHALENMGWRIVRIWEHQIEASPRRCINRLIRVLDQARGVLGNDALVDPGHKER